MLIAFVELFTKCTDFPTLMVIVLGLKPVLVYEIKYEPLLVMIGAFSTVVVFGATVTVFLAGTDVAAFCTSGVVVATCSLTPFVGVAGATADFFPRENPIQIATITITAPIIYFLFISVL